MEGIFHDIVTLGAVSRLLTGAEFVWLYEPICLVLYYIKTPFRYILLSVISKALPGCINHPRFFYFPFLPLYISDGINGHPILKDRNGV